MARRKGVGGYDRRQDAIPEKRWIPYSRWLSIFRIGVRKGRVIQAKAEQKVRRKTPGSAEWWRRPRGLYSKHADWGTTPTRNERIAEGRRVAARFLRTKEGVKRYAETYQKKTAKARRTPIDWRRVEARGRGRRANEERAAKRGW